MSTNGEEEEPEASLLDMKKMMDVQITDSSGKKQSYWSMSMETFGKADGKNAKDDLWLETVEQGVPMLKQYLKQKEEENSQNWEMVNVKTKSFPGIQMRKDDASTEGTNARKLDLQLVWS